MIKYLVKLLLMGGVAAAGGSSFAQTHEEANPLEGAWYIAYYSAHDTLNDVERTMGIKMMRYLFDESQVQRMRFREDSVSFFSQAGVFLGSQPYRYQAQSQILQVPKGLDDEPYELTITDSDTLVLTNPDGLKIILGRDT